MITNIIATSAALVVLSLTSQFIDNDRYPTSDEKSGIGQGIGVQYIGSSSNAPSRTTGIVVSRIITDYHNGGEKWCLVEFGDGPPWKSFAIKDLKPIAISKALKDFPKKGMKTVEAMLGE